MNNLTPPAGTPLLYLPFFARSLRDLGSCECSVSQAGSGLRWGGNHVVRDAISAASTGRLVATNEPAIETVTDHTFIAQIRAENNPALQRLFSKRDAGGTQIEVIFANTTQIQMYDGSVVSAYNLGNWLGVHTFVIVQANGNNAEIYINGAIAGSFSAANTITANDADVNILNLFNGTQPCFAYVSAILWYGKLLDAVQIAETHTWLENRFSPRVSPDRQYWDRSSWVPMQQPDQCAAWAMDRITNNEIADRSGNEKHATVNGLYVAQGTGGKGVVFDGNSSDASVSALTLGNEWTITAVIRFDTDTAVYKPIVYTRQGEKGFALSVRNLKVYGGGGDTSFTFGAVSSGDLEPFQKYLIHLTYDGTSYSLYVNGNLVDGPNVDDFADSGNPVYIGSTGTGNYFNGTVSGLVVDCRVKLFGEISSEGTKFTQTVLFNETWGIARPSVNNITAGNTLDGTNWYVETGVWKISEDATWKGPECVSTGTIVYQGVDNSDLWTVTTFEQKAGAPVLNRLSDRLEIDGTTGDKVGEVILTVG